MLMSGDGELLVVDALETQRRFAYLVTCDHVWQHDVGLAKLFVHVSLKLLELVAHGRLRREQREASKLTGSAVVRINAEKECDRVLF